MRLADDQPAAFQSVDGSPVARMPVRWSSGPPRWLDVHPGAGGLSSHPLDYFRDTGTSLESFRETLSGPAGPPPFEQLVARGELPDEPRPARVVSLPMDLLRHDILMTLGPVTADAIVEMIDLVWLPLLRG